MKLIFTLAWGILLFVFTCTSNLDALLYHQSIHFHWISRPDFADLLITKDAHFTDPYYIFIKLGHMAGFGILFLWVYLWIRRTSAAIYTILYAVITEILQLYFARDGRIIDMGIDTLGILFTYFLLQERKMVTAENVKQEGH